jgi:transcriptional regulator with XRE-family HTH domain
VYDFLPILSRIKAAKADAGFTNEELSAKSGIAIGTINKILTGDTKEPKLPALMAIASALGVSVDFLIYGKVGTLEEKEAELLLIYNRLNEEGREKLLDYAHDLIDLPKYKKDSQPRMVDQAQ